MTAEMELLAAAIIRYQGWPFEVALRRAMWSLGEHVPEEEGHLVPDYAARIDVATRADGYRYVSRDGALLLCIGPLELYDPAGEPGPGLSTRCAVWYGDEARAAWAHTQR